MYIGKLENISETVCMYKRTIMYNRNSWVIVFFEILYNIFLKIYSVPDLKLFEHPNHAPIPKLSSRNDAYTTNTIWSWTQRIIWCWVFQLFTLEFISYLKKRGVEMGKIFLFMIQKLSRQSHFSFFPLSVIVDKEIRWF